jgi:hypothetical protein
MGQVKHLQDRLVFAVEAAKRDPKLTPVAEAIRSTLERVIKAVQA